MPDVYIEELTRLVDEVPPVPFAELQPVIRRSIGESAFASIDPEPLAAASIAQIHKALMTDGREVVVKIRRPGVLEQAKIDLDLLRSSADFLERRSGRAQILQVSAFGGRGRAAPARRARLHGGGELPSSSDGCSPIIRISSFRR